MNPFIKGKLNEVLYTGVVLVFLGASVISWLLYFSYQSSLVSNEFSAEPRFSQTLDTKLVFLSQHLKGAAEIISEDISSRLSRVEQNQATTNRERPGLRRNRIERRGYQLMQYNLLSPDQNVKLEVGPGTNAHYVFKHQTSYLRVLDVFSKNKDISSVMLIADMGQNVFQTISQQNLEISASLFEWLSIYRQSWQPKSEVKDVIFMPPLLKGQLLSNYIMVELPVGNDQPVYLVVELSDKALELHVDEDVKYVIWQTDNKRVVSSNIGITKDYAANTQNFLITRYIPTAWHDEYLKDLFVENDVQIRVHSGLDILTLTTSLDFAPYHILFFKDGGHISPMLWQQIAEKWLFLLLIGAFCLAVFYFLVVNLFARPIANFISFIEQQNSLYEIKSTVPPKGWEVWFEKVNLSFEDNRKLFNSLVSKNKQLDKKIQERTAQLQLETISKDRNLALNRAIINSMPDMVYFKNVDGSFVGCNKEFERLSGISEVSLINKFVEDIFEPDMAKAVSEFDHHALKTKHIFSAKLWHNIAQQPVYINWLVAPILNNEGEVLGTVGLGRDITEQDAIFRQVEQARNDAELANKTKSEFIANMSHEIRTPMNAIIGMLELLNSASPSPIQRSYLDIAESSSRHLLQVINDILDFSKMNAGKLELNNERFDLKDVLDIAFANSLSTAMQKELVLDIDLPLDFPTQITADKIRLSQILTNLINNAVKFTQKGNVSFKARVLSETHEGHLVTFSVVDTGLGIPLEKQEVIFEAFSQVDTSITRQFGGTGLGLAIVFQLVELMGGKIEVSSKEGQGTEFKITLMINAQNPLKTEEVENQNWYVFDHHEECKALLNNKLANCGQTIYTSYEAFSALIDEEEKGRTEDHKNVIVCSPSMLSELPKNLLAAIQRQTVEYQPVVFNLSHFSQNMLSDIAFRPIISMPFAADAIVNNSNIHVLRLENKYDLKGMKLLVVEDNEVNQQVIKLMLESLGASIDLAENGLEGLRKTNQHHYDAILLDIQMPIMDGLTYTQKVRAQERFKSLPIIAMTAHISEEDQARSKAVGISVHLNKPIDKNQLLLAITTLVNNAEPWGNQPIIDLDNLKAQFGNDYSSMLKLLAVFESTKKDDLISFSEHIKFPIGEDVYEQLHNVEGMLANVRAQQLVIITKLLRESMKEGDVEKTLNLKGHWLKAIQELFQKISLLK